LTEQPGYKANKAAGADSHFGFYSIDRKYVAMGSEDFLVARPARTFGEALAKAQV
jgi:hypothetical protein